MQLPFGIAGADAVAAACFVELCRAGSKAIGFEIVPRQASSYDALRELVRKELALAWTPPLPGAQMVSDGDVEPLVVPIRNGAASFASAFVVKAGAGARAEDWPTKRALAALSGKRVAWVDPKSASGCVLPKLHLASHGFDPAKFFASEEFVGTHLAALDAVTSGRVDVTATFCRVAQGRVMNGGWLRADGRSIRNVEVAATTRQVPNDAIIVAKGAGATARAALLRWFLSPDDVSRPLLLELMTTHAFRTAEPGHFAPLAALLHSARAAGYLVDWAVR